MPRLKNPLLWIATLGFAASIYAAPILVGILKGSGPGKFVDTAVHTASTAISTMLANPAAAGIGPNLVIPPVGFQTTLFGQVSGTYGVVNAAEITAFINALDTLDVAILLSNSAIGEMITDAAQRVKLESFIARKGVVSIHMTADSWAAWAAMDSLHGARFQNHPSSDRTATLKLDTLPSNTSSPDYARLNLGLSDTTFLEEWFSFTTNASVIRAVPYLKVTVNIDEASYAGGMGGARVMGADHPMSWYRNLPTGGRFFYTAVGHRVQNYQGGANPRFLRRQLYNAIMWAGKYDATTGIQNVKGSGNISGSLNISVSGSRLGVAILQLGLHTVELLNLDGRRVAFETGIGQTSHTFKNLRPNSLYVVKISTAAGRATRLVTMY